MISRRTLLYIEGVRLRQIDVTAHSSANAEAVFALLADGATWPNWAPIDSFALERAGDPPPEGVGAIRVFKRGRVTGRDEIVEVVPGQRLGYVSISGLAIKDYRATVDVEESGDREPAAPPSAGGRRSSRRSPAPG